MPYTIDISQLDTAPIQPEQPHPAALAGAGAGTAQSTSEQAAADAVGAVFGGTHDGVSVAYDPGDREATITNTDKGSVAVTAHEAAVDPHPQYTTDAEVASAIAAHSVATDPHGDRSYADGVAGTAESNANSYTDSRTLGDLFDVVHTALTTGDIIEWDGTNWVNVPNAGGSFVPLAGGTMTGDLIVNARMSVNGSFTGWGAISSIFTIGGGALYSFSNQSLILANSLYHDGTNPRHTLTGVGSAAMTLDGGNLILYTSPNGTAGSIPALTARITLGKNDTRVDIPDGHSYAWGANNYLRVSSNEFTLRSNGGDRMIVNSAGQMHIPGKVSIGAVAVNGQLLNLQTSSGYCLQQWNYGSSPIGYIGDASGLVTGGATTDFGVYAVNNLYLIGGGVRRCTLSSTTSAFEGGLTKDGHPVAVGPIGVSSSDAPVGSIVLAQYAVSSVITAVSPFATVACSGSNVLTVYGHMQTTGSAITQGTWRCLGSRWAAGGTGDAMSALWQRIS